MAELEYWVLHSPYPDGSWRGIEKCVAIRNSPIMFESENDAAIHAINNKIYHHVPVKVTIVVPNIRGSIK